jgi:hypothetical protein
MNFQRHKGIKEVSLLSLSASIIFHSQCHLTERFCNLLSRIITVVMRCCILYLLFVHTICLVPFSSHGWTQLQSQPRRLSVLTRTSTAIMSQCEPYPLDCIRGLIKSIPNSLRHKSYQHQHDQYRFRFLSAMFLSSGDDDNNCNDDDGVQQNDAMVGIDVSSDSRLYKVRLSRATGIEYVSL